ncbi:MAG: glycosyltransferase family 2 protein [Microcoleus sp. PH2017_29_MFU_D_A]|uniref:glycosyltransferase family 2 protein n=1 Tax=unclassified Microcoleus TaxID=2642155 RepID=UPI001DB101C0|nr:MULTISPECIES: glycosyltransferase family 2 protein [unclassified Microcoleus]MCC3429168.1 glycosyltransferase family 2 protein [Microcoleus sp. PH2017_04_SCI_O_A]MCC3464491.1 glycosyltransferase family 2 protein [Microcoleus sp. PH2017_06_SFM_O_A]TAE08989.1 MAG: glycosyltransferase family 2 protein [Oscillatoriales cyanobacterium]MCC3410816.1 glycosyltransferase family 2 protein [Microcoleus sp. PH2017_02_FOX_O_A]MCC3425840.1 glycosyltransferase family 2 protein [Microcoleus sp. PH2017_01_S
MFDRPLKTPVAFIIFKRPEETQRVFAEIRKVKPSKLLVVADGPRPDKPGEDAQCAAARAIIEQVDWECEVLRNYAETNLGCRQRVSSGLDWVFDTVEEAIIIEDDCLPDSSFFYFAEELLERYRYDERIMSISGQNVQFGKQRTDFSYYFSRYTHCWSWASWRRAWRHYDLDMKLWPSVRDGNFLMDVLGDAHAAKIWTKTCQLCYDKAIDTWDFQWTFASFIQNGLNILSNVNLAANIGHGTGGTHTDDINSPYNNMSVEPIAFPLKHPPFVIRDAQADRFTQESLYDYDPKLVKKVQRKIKGLLKM